MTVVGASWRLARPVRVTYTRVVHGVNKQRSASGFRWTGGVVLTAGHVAGGSGYTVWCIGEAHPGCAGHDAQIVWSSWDQGTDWAVLDAPDLPQLTGPQLRAARLDRVEQWFEGCTGTSFPSFAGFASVTLDGRVPLGENLTAGPGHPLHGQVVSLRLVDTSHPHAGKTVEGDPAWGGASGAGITTAVGGQEYLLGVVANSLPEAAPTTMRFTPFNALDLLPREVVAEFTGLTGIDPGALEVLPDRQPLLALPYRDPSTAESALRLTRAEYGVVGFQARDEMTVLIDVANRVSAGETTGVAVLHGVGGAGKTRLGLELAARLQARGWTAGVLRPGADPSGLGEVQGPLMVLVDYADGRVDDTIAVLEEAGRRRGTPALVVLTARSIAGQWLERVRAGATDAGLLVGVDDVEVGAGHPRGAEVYAAALVALTPTGGQPPRPALTRLPEDYTTLDLVLQAFVEARYGTSPASKLELYDEVLKHEVGYWVRVMRDLGERAPDTGLLRQAAAAVTLVQPVDLDAADVALRIVPRLAENAPLRDVVARALFSCLQPVTGDHLAVRPDPVGDHLLLAELALAPVLLTGALASPGTHGQVDVLRVVNRAGQGDEDRAAELTAGWVHDHGEQWAAVLEVAAEQSGPVLAALLREVERDDATLPVDEVSEAVPFSPWALYELGAAVDRARLSRARSVAPGSSDVARLLDRLAYRFVMTGDRAGALATATESVKHYRVLAEANPAAYLPDLAMSLNNLANRQSETGDRAGALATATESVKHYRVLAEANPAAYLPDLAVSLNNLATCQSETGDRAGALATATESVEHYRVLAEANPAAYLPDLAMSLNNLANRPVRDRGPGGRAGDGDRGRRALPGAGRGRPRRVPARPRESLNNLANRQSETGDRAGALATATESVKHYRALAEANPAAYLPDLAVSLNNLANRQSETGDRAGALATATESVKHYRALAEADPAAYLPDLAMSLNNLATLQSETGDRAGALATATEAVKHRRVLAEANPAAYLPDLAGR